MSPSTLPLSPFPKALPDCALLLFYLQKGPVSAASSLEGWLLVGEKLRHSQTDGFMNINTRAREDTRYLSPAAAQDLLGRVTRRT